MASGHVDTPYPFIKVFNDGVLNPTFPLTVIEALGQINSKPVGAKLLKAIADSKVKAGADGWKVRISRSNATIHVVIGQPGQEGGSKAAGADESKAKIVDEGTAKSGAGTRAYCVWNPNIFNTPNGARPAFIGLAHELIHCYHMVTGTMKHGYDDEEKFTVGLDPHAAQEITENAIRREHTVPMRTQY